MKKRAVKTQRYQLEHEKVVFGLGLIPEEGVPEIKITYTRARKEFLGKVTSSRDAADFIRRTFRAGSLE